MALTLLTTEFLDIHEALTGTGKYSDGTALIQYTSETDTQYETRQEVVWYVNDILPAVQRFVGYLAKRPPSRPTENKQLTEIKEDVDWKGNSLDVFWQDFMLQAKARGTMLLLIESPQENTERDIPYFVSIKPETVVDYELDDNGAFLSVVIESQKDGKAVKRGWDTSRWWVSEGSSEIESGEHGLGLCPIIAMTETGDFPSLGPFAGIVTLSKRLINLRSELDEILRRHTFPVFHADFPILAPVEGETPESLNQRQTDLINSIVEAIAELGANRGLVTPGHASFIAPPDGPAAIYRTIIADLEAKVNEIALVPEQPSEGNSQESGIALSIRFQALNGALTSFARRMEDLERRAWTIISKRLGLPDDVAVTWARDYQIADPQTELETLGAMQASGFPAEANQEQMKTIAQLQFASGDPEAFANVIASIDEMKQEPTEKERVETDDD